MLYMVTFTINIPPMLACIPGPHGDHQILSNWGFSSMPRMTAWWQLWLCDLKNALLFLATISGLWARRCPVWFLDMGLSENIPPSSNGCPLLLLKGYPLSQYPICKQNHQSNIGQGLRETSSHWLNRMALVFTRLASLPLTSKSKQRWYGLKVS